MNNSFIFNYTFEVLPYCNHKEPQKECSYCQEARLKVQAIQSRIREMALETYAPSERTKLSIVLEESDNE